MKMKRSEQKKPLTNCGDGVGQSINNSRELASSQSVFVVTANKRWHSGSGPMVPYIIYKYLYFYTKRYLKQILFYV